MDGRSGTLARPDGATLPGQLAALLAETGEAQLSQALTLLVTGLGLSSIVLRAAAITGGELRAVAGDVVHVVPATRGLPPGQSLRPVRVELPVRCGGQDLATLTVVGARPAQLPALKACAAVLALVLAPRRTPEPDPSRADALVLAEAADREDLADDLHDGPVQALVVARYAADAVVRGADPVLAREAVQAALVLLRRTLWQLRPRGTAGLPDALRQLDEALCEGGHPPLELHVDAAAAVQLPDAAALMAYRLVQAAALADRTAPLVVALARTAGRALLEVRGDVPSLARWELRLRALGATTTVSAGGLCVDFPLPAHLPPCDPKATL